MSLLPSIPKKNLIPSLLDQLWQMVPQVHHLAWRKGDLDEAEQLAAKITDPAKQKELLAAIDQLRKKRAVYDFLP